MRRRAGPSLASALFGAGLLVVLGFALGIVAGLMLEEPQLLLDYVTGKTRSVALAPVSAPAPAEVAAPPAPTPGAAPKAPPAAPAPVRSELDAVRAETPAPPISTPAAPAAKPAASELRPEQLASAGRGFSVQVGAFADSAPAEQLARRLEGKGLPVYVAPSTGPDARKWRVRVGPLVSRDDAERIAERLEKQDRLPTWVMAEGSP